MDAFLIYRLRRLARFLRGGIANGALTLASIVIGLLIMEGVLRVANPVDLRVKGDKIVLSPLTKVVMDGSAWPKFDKEIVQTHNALGLRGDNPPQDFERALSIITVGGSTTECYYLSDDKTWPYRLGIELKKWFPRVWVNNAGMDGQTTFGHIKLIDQYISDLSPKVVLIMAGVNDHAVSQEGLYDGNVRPNPPSPTAPMARIGRWLSRNSELYALGFVISRSLTAMRTGVGHGNIKFDSIGALEVPATDADLVVSAHRPYLPGYEERLRVLVGMIRAKGGLPVLVTQTAMWGEGIDQTTGKQIGLWPSGVEPLPDGRKINVNGAVSWRVLELYNDVVRGLGPTLGVSIVDLGRKMDKDSRFFYDWYHMTNEGAAEAGRIIARDLCPTLMAAFPGQAGAAACAP